MDAVAATPMADRHAIIQQLIDHLVRAVGAARSVEEPFHHLELDRVFPEPLYADMMAAMLVAADYRAMSGRTKRDTATGGSPTRIKIDLLPEFVRHLPADKRSVWGLVGRALCSPQVKAAFVRGLGPGLARRFGPDYASVGMYPDPILTRDVAGYSIGPHPDTHWKGITVQLYLPPDAATLHIGTVFNQRLADGSFVKHSQMKFAPNTGYAFAVGTDTWHSVETVGPEVKTRDSILFTYAVDAGWLRFTRNRVKRAGNLLRNEWRHLVRR